MSGLRRSLAALGAELRGDPPPLEPAPRSEPKEEVSWLAVAGYVAAIFVPVLGIVLAVPLVVRAEYRHTAGVLLTVVASFLIRMALMTSGGGAY